MVEPIRVVVARPGKIPTIEMLTPTVEGWRSVTEGGPLALLPIDHERGLFIYICDEMNVPERKLPVNFRVNEGPEGVIRGSCVGFKLKGPDEISLTDEEAKDVQRMFFEAGRATALEEMMRKSPAMALGLGLFAGTGAGPKNPFLKGKVMPPDNGRGR